MLSDDAKVLLGIGLATVVIFAGIALSVNQGNQPADPIATEILVRDDSWKKGNADAPVTLVEFLDPECEACRAAHPNIKKVVDEYQEQLTYVVRYFPLHGNSVLAATAAEAAGEQNKYWEMLDILFARQTQWGEQKEPQTELFVSYGEELGLDMEKFTATLNSSTYTEKIERDRRDGVSAGVNSTPTIFINGVIVDASPTYATLKALIEKELEASK